MIAGKWRVPWTLATSVFAIMTSATAWLSNDAPLRFSFRNTAREADTAAGSSAR